MELMRIFPPAVMATAVLALTVAPAVAKAPDKTVTAKSNGGSIKLKKGAKLTVKLRQSSDGGYRWTTGKATKARVLKLIKMSTVAKPCTGSPYCAIGADTTFVATYKAVGKGRTKVRLVEKRSFEPATTKPIASFRLSVRVK